MSRWFLRCGVCLLALSWFSSSALAERIKIDCTKASLTKLRPGWGRIPPALQKLPPGATLCGANGAGAAVITSELEGEALAAFYAPFFAAQGCKPLTCKAEGSQRTRCSCPRTDKNGRVHDLGGEVSVSPFDQTYSLFYLWIF